MAILYSRRSGPSPTTNPSETRYLWCGETICQRRNGQDYITARYFPQGELHGSDHLYYMKNHLGSVTDLVSGQGTPLGTLDYGPYGEARTAEGRLPDFRYAGMLHHASTGFYLTHYRVYDPDSARWLSRDPIGEAGGINLYGHVLGNPLR